MITLTERDKSALQFTGKWRFASLDQLQKAGIFTVSSKKRVYNRLLQLCQYEYLKAGLLGRGQIYYRLTPKGGDMAGFCDMYWSRRFKDARRDVVLKTLTACDFSLAVGVEYLSKKEAFDQLKSAQYDVIKSCLRGDQLYYMQDNVLHVLTIDYNLSLKYLAQKISAYSRLQPGLRDLVALDFLVFSDSRQIQVMALQKGTAVKVSAILANWKY